MTGLDLLEWTFWMSMAAVVYAYAGYFLALTLLSRMFSRPLTRAPLNAVSAPTVTVIVPVHNERGTIEAKVQNVRALRYPRGRLEVLAVCDGCTDGTAEYLFQQQDDVISVLELERRGGKAAALNEGLARARHDIVVFSDASIMLEPEAIGHIVRPFASADVGCVSGEDRIAEAGGESLYGRYELSLRRLESRLHSIVGASGSFYAQRRDLCEPFPPGLAPDFYSVLRTVARGYRAVDEPEAVGVMAALGDHRAEFSRKVRTILRGITTLARFAYLLNPIRYGWFAFELFSHKLMRWLVPLFLAPLLVSSAALASESPVYFLACVVQVVFYALAALALLSSKTVAQWMPAKVSLYFTAANVAAASAWLKFLAGTRQELWSPSRR